MVAGLVIERPDADAVRVSGGSVPRIEAETFGPHGVRVINVRRVHDFHGPAGPRAGQGHDVELVVAVVHAHAEQLHDFAGVIFIGDVGPVAAAVHGVEIDNFRRAFDVDFQEVVEVAVRVEQRGLPLHALAEFPVGGEDVHQVAVVVEAVKVIRALRVLGHEMVLEELQQHLDQLALGAHGVQHMVGAQVVQVRAAHGIQGDAAVLDAGVPNVLQAAADVAGRAARLIGLDDGVAGIGTREADGERAAARRRQIPEAHGVGEVVAEARVVRLEDGIAVARAAAGRDDL